MGAKERSPSRRLCGCRAAVVIAIAIAVELEKVRQHMFEVLVRCSLAGEFFPAFRHVEQMLSLAIRAGL